MTRFKGIETLFFSYSFRKFLRYIETMTRFKGIETVFIVVFNTCSGLLKQ